MNIASLLRKKWLLAAVAAAVVGSAAYAFAATLGVSSGTLGAGNTTVSSCSSSVGATYSNKYDANQGKFVVGTVTLAFDTGTTCTNGDQIEVVLTGASNAALASFVYTVGATDDLSSTDATKKTIIVTANDGTNAAAVSGTGYTDGALSAGPDGTDFTSAGAATNGATAVPAENVTGVAVSAVGAAA